MLDSRPSTDSLSDLEKTAMKNVLAAAVLALAAGASGCLGPNKLFNSVHEWNEEATDQDWVNEVVFLGFHLIPVYHLSYLLDIVVLNTIEYWTGDPLD